MIQLQNQLSRRSSEPILMATIFSAQQINLTSDLTFPEVVACGNGNYASNFPRQKFHGHLYHLADPGYCRQNKKTIEHEGLAWSIGGSVKSRLKITISNEPGRSRKKRCSNYAYKIWLGWCWEIVTKKSVPKWFKRNYGQQMIDVDHERFIDNVSIFAQK